MRLVYLWVENYRCFKEQGFHFTNKYRFSFKKTIEDSSKYRLTFEKNDCYVSAESFYGNTFLDFRIFVGENGRGKTTLFRLLQEVIITIKYPLREDDFFLNNKVLVVFQKDDRFICWKSGNLVFFVPDGFESINKNQNMLIPFCFFDNEKKKEDMEYQLEFIYKNTVENLNNWLDFPVPKKMIIKPYKGEEIYTRAMDSLYRLMSQSVPRSQGITKSDYYDYYGKINRILRGTYEKIRDWAEQQENKLRNTVCGAVIRPVCMMALYGVLVSADWRRSSEVERVCTEAKELADGIVKIDDVDLEQLCGIILKVNTFCSEKLVGIIPKLVNLLEFEKDTSELVFKIHDQDDKKTSQEAINNFKELYKEYYELIQGDSNAAFLEFSWGLSSGEYCVLNTFSHIFKSRENEFTAGDNEKIWILILDEIDLSLHPRWQQNYVSMVVNFLEKIWEGKVQLILATHSPIVLSDVYWQFITYLESQDNSTTRSKVQEVFEEKRKKTYGANIYDLYKDSFFLDFSNVGILGKFVSGKIEEIKKTIERIDTEIGEKNKGHENAESEKIEEWVCLLRECKLKIDYIDDDVLRRILLNLLNSVIRKVRIKEREDAILYISSIENDEFEELKKSMNEIRMKKERQKIE